MHRFRLFIYKDPEARERGFSLAGIKIPLTTFCPIKAPTTILGFDDLPCYGKYAEYWQVPTSLLVLARPELRRHLKDIMILLVPTDWCDVAPVANFNDLNKGI